MRSSTARDATGTRLKMYSRSFSLKLAANGFGNYSHPRPCEVRRRIVHITMEPGCAILGRETTLQLLVHVSDDINGYACAAHYRIGLIKKQDQT